MFNVYYKNSMYKVYWVSYNKEDNSTYFLIYYNKDWIWIDMIYTEPIL
jgi:hypothetical protein